MKKHRLTLFADRRIPATAPYTDGIPHAVGTAECLEWLGRAPVVCDPYVPLYDARAITLTVGRIVVLIAHECEGYAVAIYQDGERNGTPGRCPGLADAWAAYLHECARMTAVLAANIQTHVDATKALAVKETP